MSEKLTVAELLARSGRTSSDSGRRRRRRSLDEGGISVAELTGAIPVVEDTESEASTAPAAGADKREQPTADRAEAGLKQAEKAEKAKQAKAAEEAAAKKAAEEKAKKAEAEKAKQVEAEKAKRAKEAAAKKAAEEKAAAKKAAEEKAKKAEAEKVKQLEAEKAKKAKEAAAKKAAEDKTKKGAAQKAEQKKPEPKTAAPAGTAIVDRREVPAQRPEEKTSEIPAVTDKGAPAKKNTEPSTEQTALITKVSADQAEGTEAAKDVSATKALAKGADRKDAEHKGSGAGAAAAAATAGAAGTAAATRGSDAERKDGQPAPEEFHSPEQLEELQRTLGEDEVIEYEDDTISWPALIGQAIAAILVGIGVFLGFKLLWGSLPAVLVLVLALAVTLVMVGVVHALLRHRDKLIMILTFVVGLVLTIGPRLIMSI